MCLLVTFLPLYKTTILKLKIDLIYFEMWSGNFCDGTVTILICIGSGKFSSKLHTLLILRKFISVPIEQKAKLKININFEISFQYQHHSLDIPLFFQ